MSKNNDISFNNLCVYPITKKIAPICYKLKILPNHVTILNIFLRFYITYALIKKYDKVYILVLLLLSEILDNLDGTIAKMYKQHSKFGATLDHVSDKIFWSIVIIIVISQCKHNKSIKNMLVYVSLFMLFIIIISNFTKKYDLNNYINDNSIPIILFYYFFYYNYSM